MAGVDHFQTDRLVARRLRLEDFELIRHMNTDPEVMKTLGGVRTDDETHAFMRQSLEHWEQFGYGVWTLWARGEEEFVGRAGLRHVAPEGIDEVEVHLGLMPSYWGKGLGTEVIAAMLRIGFEQLALDSIIGFTLTTNKASQRAMEKAGFHYEQHFRYKGLPHVLNRITRREFLQAAENRNHPSGTATS